MDIIKQPKSSRNEEEEEEGGDIDNDDEGITWGMGISQFLIVSCLFTLFAVMKF